MRTLHEAYKEEILGQGYKDSEPIDDSDSDYAEGGKPLSKVIRDDDFSFIDPLTKEVKTLDAAQIEIITDLESLIDDEATPRGTLRILSGAGGHGKSALESVLLRRNKRVTTATATTNKACAVLKAYGGQMDTCHRVFMCPIKANAHTPEERTVFLSLGQTEKLCEEKNLRLPKSWFDKKARLGKAPTFLVVDEASQMNTQLWQAILEANFKVILLIGDTNQCPPINDVKNPLGIFNQLPIHYTLKVNYRLQGFLKNADAPQREHYKAVARTLEALRDPQFHVTQNIVTNRDWINFLEPLLPSENQTLSQLFNEGYQFISHTNQTRRQVNYLARLAFLRSEYGHDEPTCEEIELVAGETIMLKSNSREDSENLFNGKLLEVTGSALLGDRICVSYQFGGEQSHKMLINGKFLNWDMSGFTKKRGSNEVPNSLPHDWLIQLRADNFTSNSDYGDANSSASADEAIADLFNNAADVDIISEPASDADDILKIVLGYCITIHNSQGSEFPKVCAIVPQHLLGRSEDSRRLLYTALSRTKGQLIVVPESWRGFKNFLR